MMFVAKLCKGVENLEVGGRRKAKRERERGGGRKCRNCASVWNRSFGILCQGLWRRRVVLLVRRTIAMGRGVRSQEKDAQNPRHQAIVERPIPEHGSEESCRSERSRDFWM